VHDLVLDLALGWLCVLLVTCAVMVLRARPATARILALDTLTLVLVAVLVLFSAKQGVSYYLDAALILALLSFIGTVAAARFHARGRLFS
jgi:multicomponent Na+:H+ antiporter subunit F